MELKNVVLKWRAVGINQTSTHPQNAQKAGRYIESVLVNHIPVYPRPPIQKHAKIIFKPFISLLQTRLCLF